MTDVASKFIALTEVIARLRAPDGCPWDRKQTPQTFKGYLVEETHELLEAVGNDDAEHVCEELGDMLFQVLFLAALYQEQQRFTLADALDAIIAKMIRRHPHVFADETIQSEQEQRQRWQTIKAQEKRKGAAAQFLDAVPSSMPALQKAQRVAERAARAGFAWPDAESALAKAAEELGELQTALADGRRQEIFAELGDLLFALVVFSATLRLDGEEALGRATGRFIARFKAMESLLSGADKAMAAMGTAELTAAWQQAKSVVEPEKTIDREDGALL